MLNRSQALDSDISTAELEEKAKLLLSFKAWNSSIGEPLGDQPPDGWEPEEYLYYRIALSANSNVLTFKYDFSGYVASSDTMDGIGTFLEALKNNYDHPDTFLTKFSEKGTLLAPTMRLVKPCYVILHLKEDWNWQFAPAVEGMRTQDPLQGKYSGLVHVDDSWNPSEGVANSTTRTNIIYFAATSIIPRASNKSDPFNLFVVLKDGNKAGPIVIDPDIKNDGGGTH